MNERNKTLLRATIISIFLSAVIPLIIFWVTFSFVILFIYLAILFISLGILYVIARAYEKKELIKNE